VTVNQINPNQQQQPDELSLGEALRAIAERTAFRTESERDAVLATIDKHTEADRQQREADEREQAEADERERADQGDQGDQGNAAETPAQPVKATPATAKRGR
jgi:hypothetical protein